MFKTFKKGNRKNLRLIFSQSTIVDLNENYYDLSHLYSFEDFFIKIDKGIINSREGIGKIVIKNELVVNSLLRFDNGCVQIGAVCIPVSDVFDTLEDSVKILWIKKTLY